MEFSLRFKKILEDPYIVARIQNLFGVSYKGINAIKATSKEAQNAEETKTFQRRKSGQHSSSYHEIKENSHQVNETTSFEDRIQDTEADHEAESKNLKNYVVKNKFWYFLFLFGTYLGDDIGYAISIPFLAWNIDAVVARKLVLVWTIIMYAGQSIKDILKWPRPMCPPVIRLQKKWSLEYGMPSTHAMVGIAFPSSVLYYSLKRYEFPVIYGIVISVLWCIVISLSRLYLGMHSVLDIIAGLFLASVMVVPLLPAIEYIDNEWFKPNLYYYPLGLFIITLILLGFYPSERNWTPTKSDTSTILGTCVGFHFGYWLNFHLNYVQFSDALLPYPVEIPDKVALGYAVLRLLVGVVCMVLSFVIFEILFKIVDIVIEKLLGIAPRVANEKQHIPILDLSYKYLSYCITSFHVSYSIPILFHYLHIENSSYYVE